MAAKAVLPFGAEKTDDTDPAEPANTELSIQCLTSRKYSITVQNSNSTYIESTQKKTDCRMTARFRSKTNPDQLRIDYCEAVT